MTPAELVGLTALIDRGQLEGAAAEARRLWSSSREPALARLLESFPRRKLPPNDDGSPRIAHWLKVLRLGDALMMPALLAEVEAVLAEEDARAVMPYLRALAVWPGDPRVGAACMRWLVDPARVRAPDAALLSELEKVVTRHADQRHGDALSGLPRKGNRWSERLPGAATAAVLDRLVMHGETLVDRRRSLPAEVERALDDLAERVSRLRPDSPQPEAIEKGLLRIRFQPDDEAARAVFRDLLLEAGDPWGELIVLQEVRAAKGEAKSSTEEKQLLRRVEPRILGTLSVHRAGIVQPLEYRRGFLTDAAIRAHGFEVGQVMAHSELSTLEKVRFHDAAAITSNLVLLKEAHGVTLADLYRAQQQAPRVKLKVVTVKNASVAELTGAQWWPELSELYVTDPRCQLEQLLALPVAKQLNALGLVERPAATAFDGVGVAMLSAAPPSVRQVRLDAVGEDGELGLTWVRAAPGWRAEVSGTKAMVPRPERSGAGSVLTAVAALRRCVRGSLSVTVHPGTHPQLRRALEQP